MEGVIGMCEWTGVKGSVNGEDEHLSGGGVVELSA